MTKYFDVATYWVSSGGLDAYGNYSTYTSQSIDVRWEDKTELYVMDDVGQELRSSAVVYTETEIEVNGWLYLGQSSETSPKSQTGAKQVMKVNKIKSLKGNNIIYKIML